MNKSQEKNIIIYVMNLPEGAVESIRRYEKISKKKYRIMLLWDKRVRDKADKIKAEGIDIALLCDFSKPHKIAEALRPYQDEFLAITCRSEQNMARFAQVIPHVPYLRTPTTDSLKWASDKYEMRKRLKIYDPSITPIFALLKENSKAERNRVATKVGFPMIIKPTNLAASLFVSICYHEEDLEKALRTTLSRLKSAYKDDNRLEEPKIIVEQFMDGDMYSIDSYVTARGRVEHCPLVKVKTGKMIGHDDFFGYLQITPPLFKRTTVERAEMVAEKAIHALGLRSTITHTELMKVDDEWKVIEIGARMGGFRHELYMLTCGIDHSLNDVLVRIPSRIVNAKKCTGYACAMKWFATKEGKITEMKGIKKIEQLESFHRIEVNKKVGDKAVFARNGGRSIFNLFLKNADRSKLLADIRRVEQMVKVKVVGRDGVK
jgi:biotin carboxylase